MLLFPLCMIALAYLIHLLMPDDYVVLYPDRMELPICGKRKRLLAWSKVKSLRWSMNGRTDPIQVFIARSGLMLFPWIFLYLTRISLSDRVTLIRYLRTAGAGVQQDGWPEFCLKRAIPTVGESQNAKNGNSVSGWKYPVIPSFAKMDQRFPLLYKKHPFFAGMLLPLLLPGILLRRAWWIMAGSLALSAIVNIRMFWGQWAHPFTAIVLGAAAGMFLLGLFAPRGVSVSFDREAKTPDIGFWLSIIVFVVGMPIVGNLEATGRIPRMSLPYSMVAFMLVVCALAYMHQWKRNRCGR